MPLLFSANGAGPTSERRALRLVGMSASALRYEHRDDGNGRLRSAEQTAS